VDVEAKDSSELVVAEAIVTAAKTARERLSRERD
jgi:hypothetical protein